MIFVFLFCRLSPAAPRTNRYGKNLNNKSKRQEPGSSVGGRMRFFTLPYLTLARIIKLNTTFRRARIIKAVALFMSMMNVLIVIRGAQRSAVHFSNSTDVLVALCWLTAVPSPQHTAVAGAPSDWPLRSAPGKSAPQMLPQHRSSRHVAPPPSRAGAAASTSRHARALRAHSDCMAASLAAGRN